MEVIKQAFAALGYDLLEYVYVQEGGEYPRNYWAATGRGRVTGRIVSATGNYLGQILPKIVALPRDGAEYGRVAAMETVWIVGRAVQSISVAPDAMVTALPPLSWELRGIYTHEEWAINGCRTPLDFVAEVVLDTFLNEDDEDRAIMQVRYPLPVGA